ncbi:MAG: conjugal transfer protein TraA, partial [Phyllobacterium sp.]
AEGAGGKRPHVHVHAIVAMRSDAGNRIETTIAAFRHWRLTMAEKARAHGINMEMTDRRERASPAAYSKNQVRQVNTIGRTEHQGTSEAAQRRYDAKRSDERVFAHTARSVAYSAAAQKEWQEVANSQENQAVRGYAEAQIDRLRARKTPTASQALQHGGHANSSSQLRTHLVKLSELVSEGDDMRHMTRPEFEAYEKRVETALFRAERTMPASERADFDEIASAAREHVNVRRELVELNEQRTPGETAEPQERSTPDKHRDDEKQRWNDAVSRHGLAAADAANKVLIDIEKSRAAIERPEAGDQGPDKMAALRQELDLRLTKAAELGAAGNGLIREAAEMDEELKATLQSVERERQKVEREKASAGSELSGGDPERGIPGGVSAWDFDGQSRKVEGQENERDAVSHWDIGDTTRGNPAKQHVPRLEELQREVDERDDREQ